MTRRFLRVPTAAALTAFVEGFWDVPNTRVIVSPPKAGDQIAYLAFDVGDAATYHQVAASMRARRVGLIPMSPVPVAIVARHPNAFFLVTSDCFARAKISALRAAATLSISAARPSAHQIGRIVDGLWANMNGRPSEGDLLLDSCRIG